ncbi:polyprenyl synthetase family protein [bacterium]|nr:polyprenyl synthetase family protein [bacterium]
MEWLKNNQKRVIKTLFTIDGFYQFPKEIQDAMFYALDGGKGVRASLLVETTLSINPKKDDKSLWLSALAIEMIHAYSLIHDDLPALDNDDLRRGKATVHKMFGEDIAILTGDALLNTAFEVLLQTEYSDSIKLQLIKKLGKAAGAQGMIKGQVIDLKHPSSTIDELKYLHSLKTGEMITVPIEFATIITECDLKIKDSLVDFSKKIGIAFQAKDDLLDIIGDEDSVGKKLQKDLKQNKKTYPYFLGIADTKKEIDYLTSSALNILENCKFNFEKLKELTYYLKIREK